MLPSCRMYWPPEPSLDELGMNQAGTSMNPALAIEDLGIVEMDGVADDPARAGNGAHESLGRVADARKNVNHEAEP